MPHVAARRVLLPPGPNRRVFPRWIALPIGVALVLAVTLKFAAAYWEDYRLDREEAAWERERQDLVRKNAQLSEEARLLETPDYIERLAREQLGLVKKDEIAVMLVELPPEPAAPEEPPPEPPARPWWRRWLKILGW